MCVTQKTEKKSVVVTAIFGFRNNVKQRAERLRKVTIWVVTYSVYFDLRTCSWSLITITEMPFISVTKLQKFTHHKKM